MTDDPNDVVRVAAGDDLVMIELHQQALKEAGIVSRIVGGALDASFGTAIPNSIELWVHRSDVEKALAAIAQMEAESKHPHHDRPEHPTDDPAKPHPGGHGPHTHHNPDPRS
jgi:hypothetical protein